MDIYATEGHKVIATDLDNGYPHHAELAKKHLTKGEIYTVDYTEVENWHTDVYLKEFPDIAFNVVHFEDAT